MSDLGYQPAKLFSIEQANATLPLVRAIVKDLAKLSREVVERRGRIHHLNSQRDRDQTDPYSEELSQIEEELEKDTQRLQEYVEELRQLGVEPKDGPKGLVDFPAMIDDHLVYLCWQLGEPEVLHWHELDGGFDGRRPLTALSVAEDAGDDGSSLDNNSLDGG